MFGHPSIEIGDFLSIGIAAGHNRDLPRNRLNLKPSILNARRSHHSEGALDIGLAERAGAARHVLVSFQWLRLLERIPVM
jgi:hypothetical protein